MAVDKEVGSADMRSQFFDKAVKQIAQRKYKFKQAVTISPTSAWKNFFYRESPTQLAGKTGNAIRGIPRGAAFPQAVVQWDKISTVIEKYGLEDTIQWEDILSDDVDVQNRTLFRITEGVVKSVDDQIFEVLRQSDTGTDINGFTADAGWNEASAAIIDDLARARQLIAEDDYDTENLMCFINPRDHRSIVKYLTDKGAQFPKISEGLANNGIVGNLMGITLIQSRSVPASRALVVVPQICGTWKELVPLQTTTIEDKYKGITIRAVEMGVTQLTDPLAVCLIKNTQMSG